MPENDENAGNRTVNSNAPMSSPGAIAGANPVTTVIWQPFAQFHFYSARVLYEKVIEVETRYDGSQQSKEALKDEHLGYVTGTILTAVAFLEALINETFLRAVKRTKGEPDDVLQKLSPNVIASMAHVWKNKVDWNSEPDLLQFLTKKHLSLPDWWNLPDKYQLALYFADKPPYKKPFFKDGNFWQDFELLKKLRNALTHYKPESIEFPPAGDPYKAETDRITELLQGLNKYNFTNPFYPGQGSLLTLLGSKCASWAIILTSTIAKELRDRMPLDLSNIIGL